MHFNTFGGNPVVSAIGKAVLEVIEKENLQTNALKLGNHIHAGLAKLKEKHKVIGDVRGQGLMVGIEMVKDRTTKQPASAECAQVLENARELGLLIGKGGLWGQTIRFAPPMCITQADADFMLEVLDEAFAALCRGQVLQRAVKGMGASDVSRTAPIFADPGLADREGAVPDYRGRPPMFADVILCQPMWAFRLAEEW